MTSVEAIEARLCACLQSESAELLPGELDASAFGYGILLYQSADNWWQWAVSTDECLLTEGSAEEAADAKAAAIRSAAKLIHEEAQRFRLPVLVQVQQ